MGQTGGSRASIKINQVTVSNPKRKMNAFGPVQRNELCGARIVLFAGTRWKRNCPPRRWLAHAVDERKRARGLLIDRSDQQPGEAKKDRASGLKSVCARDNSVGTQSEARFNLAGIYAFWLA